MKTGEEIAAAAGISRRTITRWERRGVLPKPLFEQRGDGGAMKVWEDWVGSFAAAVAEHQRAGCRLAEAVRLAGGLGAFRPSGAVYEIGHIARLLSRSREFRLEAEAVQAYAEARMKGASPEEAVWRAFCEWDL